LVGWIGGLAALVGVVTTLVINLGGLRDAVIHAFGGGGSVPAPTHSLEKLRMFDPQGPVGRCAEIDGSGDVPDGYKLWVAVLSEEPLYYLSQVPDSRINASEHQWSLSPVVIGSVSDAEGKAYHLTLLLIAADASNSIESTNDKVLAVLPSGATKVDDMNVYRKVDSTPDCYGDGESPACAPFSISANATAVNGPAGVKITVTVCGSPQHMYGWLFDYDPDDKLYYLDRDAPYTKDGVYTFDDKPIGNPGDAGKQYQVVLLVADESCNASILALKPNSYGDVVHGPFSADKGCRVTGTVSVKVTWPA